MFFLIFIYALFYLNKVDKRYDKRELSTKINLQLNVDGLVHNSEVAYSHQN